MALSPLFFVISSMTVIASFYFLVFWSSKLTCEEKMHSFWVQLRYFIVNFSTVISLLTVPCFRGLGFSKKYLIKKYLGVQIHTRVCVCVSTNPCTSTHIMLHMWTSEHYCGICFTLSTMWIKLWLSDLGKVSLTSVTSNQLASKRIFIPSCQEPINSTWFTKADTVAYCLCLWPC